MSGSSPTNMSGAGYRIRLIVRLGSGAAGGSYLASVPPGLGCRANIRLRQMGAAPLIPLTFHMGSPLKFPTQTPTVYSGVQPRHQLSLMSLLVPVFTAAGKGSFNRLSIPNVKRRCSEDARILKIESRVGLEKVEPSIAN